jgi:hypothetical protein
MRLCARTFSDKNTALIFVVRFEISHEQRIFDFCSRLRSAMQTVPIKPHSLLLMVFGLTLFICEMIANDTLAGAMLKLQKLLDSTVRSISRTATTLRSDSTHFNSNDRQDLREVYHAINTIGALCKTDKKVSVSQILVVTRLCQSRSPTHFFSLSFILDIWLLVGANDLGEEAVPCVGAVRNSSAYASQ